MKFISLLRTGVTIALLLLWSSCFEIEEIIKMNQDGSGNYTYQIDISSMLTMIESFAEEADSADQQQSYGLFEEPLADLDALAQLPGIAGVQNLNDTATGLLGYSFAFESCAALNHALSFSRPGGWVNEFFSVTYPSKDIYKLKRKKFIKLAPLSVNNQMSKVDEGADEYAGLLSAMLTELKLKTTLIFDRPIKKIKPEVGTLSDDRKSYQVTYLINEAEANPKLLGFKIKFM